MAFDVLDRPSRLRAFPYDRFTILREFYTIVPIVRMELNSIQAMEVVSVVRVVRDSVCNPYNRPGSVSSFRSFEHYLRRLRRSYGDQALH